MRRRESLRHRLEPAAAELAAKISGFRAMKLQLVKRHGGKRRAHRFRRRIDKQPDRAHQRRQQREQSLRLRERYMA
ncbi:MAG: hypothetical protein ACFNXT_02165, partial [Actinomyces massiliensis]